MTIDELRKAKREAEALIRAALQAAEDCAYELAKQPGVEVSPPEVRYVDVTSIGGGRRRVVDSVHIELRVL